MDEELAQKGQEFLLSVIGDVEKFKEFAVEQLPDIAQQIVAWGFWYNIFVCIITILVAIVPLFAFFKLFKSINWDSGALRAEDEPKFFCMVVVGVIGVIAGIFVIRNISTNGMDAVKCKFAPKIYLIEYSKDLIK